MEETEVSQAAQVSFRGEGDDRMVTAVSVRVPSLLRASKLCSNQ